MMARPRLFQWQRWLTVAEAAKYLTRALEEEVSEANIFQLALNRALTLSVRFPNQDTRAEQLTAARTYDRYGPGPHDFERGPDEEPDPDNPIITLPDGLYDLPMTGIERLDVEHEYQQRTGGPKIIARPKTVTDCDGPFVKSRLNGALFRIQREADRPDEASQSGRYLPPDAVFVVRVGALEAILPTRTERETTTRNGPSDEPIGSRDRATLLTIIAALASHAKVDISQPSKAGGIIEAMTRAIEARVAGRTIEKQLRLFQDTVERRGFSKPVGSRERATLLTIIAALASHAKVDIGQPSKAGGTIEAMTLEIKARVASQTIEEHLRGVPDALERRRSSR